MADSNNDSNNVSVDYPISIIKNSNLRLSLPSSQQPIKLAIWKDERLDYLDIPKGLIELLQAHGFTIELILESGPSQIAEKLGIDNYIAQIIFEKTRNNTKV